MEEFLANIPFVSNRFSIEKVNKSLVSQWFPVIHITRSYHEIEKFPFLVTDKVQFESEESVHGTFVPLCYAFECFMDIYPLATADTNRIAVNKTDSGALTQKDFLDEQSKGNGNLSFKFYETVV